MKKKVYRVLQTAVQFLYLELYIALMPVYIGMDAFNYKMPTYLFVTMCICGILSMLKFANIIRCEIKRVGLKNYLFKEM